MIWKLWAVVKDILNEIKRDNVGAFAAQTTFFMVVSAFPFMILFLSILQHTAVSQNQLLHIVGGFLPETVAPFVLSIIREMYHKSVEVLSVAIVGAVWSSAKGVQYLSNGLNAIYNIEENRNWFILRFRAIWYTLIFSFSTIVSILFVIFGRVLRRTLLVKYPIVNHLVRMLLGLRYLILFFILFLLFVVILKYLPNRKASFRSQMLPAFTASMFWVFMSVGISIYINFFDGFSMYGSMTTIMLILMYIYFGVYILLLCAEVDSMYEGSLRAWWGRYKKKRNSP